MIPPGRGSNRPGRDRLRFHDMSVKGPWSNELCFFPKGLVNILIYGYIKVG